MRAVVQKAVNSAVEVAGEQVGVIERGLVVFLGVSAEDDEKDIDYMVDKIANLRVFEDSEGKLNLSCIDIGAEILVISQFTLYGDCRKGRRPSFQAAAGPDKAGKYYECFSERVSELGIKVSSGRFGEQMMVKINNEGPVTLLIDSRKEF